MENINSKQSIAHGTTFQFKGNQYMVLSKLKDPVGSLNPSFALPLYETYSVQPAPSTAPTPTSQSDLSYIEETLPPLSLRVLCMQAANLFESFEPSDQSVKIQYPHSEIAKEFEILSRIKKYPYTLQCFGKTIVFDRNSTPRQGLMIQRIESLVPLSEYLENHLRALDIGSRVHLSATLVSTYSCFREESITWTEQLELGNFSFINGGACITSGFISCDISSPSGMNQNLQKGEGLPGGLGQMSYTEKRNCAQLKAMVFGILFKNHDLIQKYTIPTSVASAVEKEITQELRSICTSFGPFAEIFTDPSLTTLIAFISHLASQIVKHNQFPPPVASKLKRYASEDDDGIDCNSIEQSPKINKAHTKNDLSLRIDEDDEDDLDLNEGVRQNTFQDLNQKVNQSSKKQNKSVKVEAGTAAGTGARSILNYQFTIDNNQQNNKGGQIEIEMQNQKRPSTAFSYNSNKSGTNSSGFRSKADRLKDEENDDIQQSVKARPSFNRNSLKQREQDINAAKQILISMEAKKQESLKSENVQSVTRGGGVGVGVGVGGGSDSGARRGSVIGEPATNIRDKLLLFQGKQENDSLLSDNSLIRVILGVIIFLLVGGIIFGAVFHYGVEKTESAGQKLVCEDTNCERCDRYADECSICKTGYVMDSVTYGCKNSCSVSNCSACLTSKSVCETCETGYTLALSKCVLNADACPVTNCESCKDLACVSCSLGYTLNPSSACVRKCGKSCETCDANDAQICTKCYSPSTLNGNGLCV